MGRLREAPMYDVVCVVCGAVFRGGNRAKYCSRDCRPALQKGRPLNGWKKTCLECGSLFFTLDGVKRTCSRVCQSQRIKRRAMERNRRAGRQGQVDDRSRALVASLRICVVCASSIEQQDATSIYCGAACEAFASTRPRSRCTECGQPFDAADRRQNTCGALSCQRTRRSRIAWLRAFTGRSGNGKALAAGLSEREADEYVSTLLVLYAARHELWRQRHGNS